MQNCHACGYQQPEGNYCGGCGTALPADTEQIGNKLPEPYLMESSTRYQPKRRSDNTETPPNKLQEEVKAYLTYFKSQLINPTDGLDTPPTTKTFTITLFLLVASAVLATFAMAGDVFGVFVDTGSFLLTMTLLYSLLILISFIAVFFVTYFFAESLGAVGTLKALSGFYPAVILLNLASLLLSVLGATKLSIGFFGLALLLVSILIGAFVTVDAVRKHSKSVNGFYAYTVYFILSFVFLSYTSSKIASSILDNFLKSIFFW